MKRFLLSIVVVISLGVFPRAYAQTQDSINLVSMLNIEEDIASLEDRITKLINKTPEIRDIQGLRQFHVLLLGIDTIGFGIEKENYLDYSFLYHIYSPYQTITPKFLFGKKRQYTDAQTLITDHEGCLVAIADARYVSVRQDKESNSTSARIAKMFFDGEIDFAFMLGFPHTMQYIGIKGRELYVFDNKHYSDSSKERFIVYPWEEFIENHFDEWVRP